ncbi:MAG: hypothetical protein JF597_46055 [Streptomyces sp.]|uniref:hypothetical protein n=1 Tax=Streptomyces sp. TaxID=1931 RepID=UPI0025EDB157|nr:hypothetical protein [Streptomyces sp.]MBW8800671.1 hypothetical protein [Streptomyces sp.]
MTLPTTVPPPTEAPETAVFYRIKPRSDGSTVLALLTVGDAPYTLVQHLFELDNYLTRFLFHDLARALHGIADPGPRPEAAALLASLDSDDPTAFDSALDAYTARIHHWWAA